jgi:aminopeptidase N
MENWGLVTYREVALLADPATTSISSKHYIATVIAHELSHQWFGNLVTMKWWNNLWLNESFATLMEYIAVDALHPEWDIWMDFATTESIMALRRDSIDGVQAVQVDVNHPDEISTLFDGAIVYAKGARLLRMLQHYIGHEAFQKGLRKYFNTYKYKNTEGDDLWKALSDSSGKDIASFMNTWISQPGYPKVSVDQQDGSIVLRQTQFFVGPHTPSSKLWPIPLNGSNASMPDLLETAEFSFTPEDDTPPLLNVGSTAHFITQYDHAILAKHLEAVSDGSLPPIDRLQLLNEQTLLARAGDISSADLIPILSAYKGETIESVWDIISLSAAELRKFVEDDPVAENKLRRLSGDLARAQYQRLGWYAKPDEPETDSKLRSTIIGMMLYSEDADAIQTAVSMYETLPLEKLDPELRSLAIMAAVRYSDDPGLIDSLIDQYRRSTSGELQQDIAAGITASRDPRILARALDLIKDESVVRHQDVFRWFVWTIRNRYGRDLAWEWLQNNWEWIEQTFGGDKSYDDFPRYSANGLVNRRQLEEYRTFFNPKKKIPALSRVITMGISEIEGRVDLIERDQAKVCQALREL